MGYPLLASYSVLKTLFISNDNEVFHLALREKSLPKYMLDTW